MERRTTVNKAKLLDTMRSNRDDHHEIFLAAQKMYRQKVIEELDRRLQEARTGGRILLVFALPEPVDYTSEYDDAIARFEWHEGELVNLDETEFKQYVLDKWGWERHFMENTSRYLGA